MKTCAVILLYKQTKLLPALTKRLKECGVDYIKVVRNDLNNVGSAAGYKSGIQDAYFNTDCDFIWLLDDDNLPDSAALKNLKLEYNKHNNTNYAFSSFRMLFAEFYRMKDITKIIGTYNACLGINVLHPVKTLKNIKRKMGYYPETLPATVYGGLFFHRNLVYAIGLPDESYFLYCDDIEWTHRIVQKGGRIYLVHSSIVNDVNGQGPGNRYLMKRNLMKFQEKLSDRKWLFRVNRVLALAVDNIFPIKRLAETKL